MSSSTKESKNTQSKMKTMDFKGRDPVRNNCYK